MRVLRQTGKLQSTVVALVALVVILTGLANAASYRPKFLTSDQAGTAPNIDPNLINPWGISFSATGDFWVANNNSGTSTLYDSNGVPQSLVVTIPSASGSAAGVPTGTVFNATTGFTITKGTKSGPALFLFNSEDGVITGWNPTVDATNAVIAVNNSAASAVYKGQEMATTGGQTFLYNCNFFSNKIEVYNSSFQPVTLSGTFTDPQLPRNFAPHNIRLINGQLFVVYAKQNATKTDAVFGPGLGVVSVFDLNGNFIKRFATQGKLNAPWGIAVAPASWGPASNALLIGNLGDGTITAFNATTGASLGQLKNQAGAVIKISGLWAITFGNGGMGGATNILYFTSGPSAYAHGRFGSISFQ